MSEKDAGEDVVINIEWTLESMGKTRDNTKVFVGTCYGCRKDTSVRIYQVGVLNPRLQWSDGSGPVWEKVPVQYCDSCADKLIQELSDSSVVK